jgi:cyclopropane fatty-acyl-phospholipid synthase-like methyltransferase
MKPYSESCDQNRDPIFNIIQPILASKTAVLEIGSGTGQHAVYFAAKMPHLQWITSDRAENHSGIQQWLSEAKLDNTQGPLLLDVTQEAWPKVTVDAVFSANSTHIMHEADVDHLFAGVGRTLTKGGLFILYGPFNYGNQYTSESNANFDKWLKQGDPLRGIRNFEDLDGLATQAGMRLTSDVSMPANNRILIWQRQIS